MYYINSASFSNATSVFLDELLTDIAPDGYYSYDSYYRQQINGSLIDLLPCTSVDTVSITAIGETTATFNGNLISDGGDVNAVRGFVYGTSTNPTTANSVITDTARGQGVYSLNVTGLTSGVTYYVRAYTIVFGNTIYGDELSFMTVVICIDGWSTTNLNVSTYRDGTPIPEVTDPTEWANLTTGAWCYYNNDPLNGATYGKLYNWYAVNDSRGLAPTGYHIPSDEEWTTLIDCLGGSGVAGGKMKETGTSHWNSPNIGATNSSGFTGLPGGSRDGVYGAFYSINTYAIWWSSLEIDDAWGRSVNQVSAGAARYVGATMSYGLSVRIKQD